MGEVKVSTEHRKKGMTRLQKTVIGMVFAVATICSAQKTDDLLAKLRQNDQALLDAIAAGDRNIWDAALASEFLYADENNRVLNRADFLTELLRLPKGASGKIVIKSYEMYRVGDTAIVVHRDDETELYFGSELHAQYLMTETWQLLAGKWQLRAIHCAAIPVDAPAIRLTKAEMDELVGTYHAGSLEYVVRRDGERLLGGRRGRNETELKAETRDVLFISGQPRSRKVFTRNEKGLVTGFSDRRENRDLVWTRVDR
jgi:hypothetical protein